MTADSSRSRESTTRVSRVPHSGQRISPPAKQPQAVVVCPQDTTTYGVVYGSRGRSAALVRLVVNDVRGPRRIGSGAGGLLHAIEQVSGTEGDDLAGQAGPRLPRVAHVE